MSETTKDKDKKEEVPEVSGGFVDGPCIPTETGWPPDNGDIPGYPQNPFGPGGPFTDPFQGPQVGA